MIDKILITLNESIDEKLANHFINAIFKMAEVYDLIIVAQMKQAQPYEEAAEKEAVANG